MLNPSNNPARAAIGLSALFLIAGALAAPAQAEIVYDNGGPIANGLEITITERAEDFTFAQTTTFDTVKMWDMVWKPGTGFSGTMNWTIYSNQVNPNPTHYDKNYPGTVLYSGAAVPTSRTLTTLKKYSNTDIYENVFSTGPITLNAGTYWLGLHNGPITNNDFDDFYWVMTPSGNGTMQPHEYDLTGNNYWPGWRPDPNFENAFQLINSKAVATPEPETWAMMGIGLAAIAFMGWKRRKQAPQNSALAELAL